MAVPVGLLATAIPEVVKLATAGKQAKKAKEFEKTQRPEYNTPDSVLSATDLAQQAFLNTQLPGQRVAEERISAGTADTIRAAKEAAGGSAGLLSTITAADRNRSNAYKDLGVEAARQQTIDQRNLQEQLNRQGTYEDRAWEYNQNMPYQSAMAASSALKESSSRNLFNALNNLSAVAAGNLGDVSLGRMINPKDSVFGEEEMNSALSDLAGMGVNPLYPHIPVGEMEKQANINPISISPLMTQIPFNQNRGGQLTIGPITSTPY